MIVCMSNAGTILESKWAKATLDPCKWMSRFFPVFFPWLSSNCIRMAVSISASTRWAFEQKAAEISRADACFGAFPVFSKQTLYNSYSWIWATSLICYFYSATYKIKRIHSKIMSQTVVRGRRPVGGLSVRSILLCIKAGRLTDAAERCERSFASWFPRAVKISASNEVMLWSSCLKTVY